MVATLERARKLSANTSAVWPGFHLSEQVLIITAPSGPTVLAGDPSPPADFRPFTPGSRVFIREGTPPDSLTGLRIGLPWNGKRATAIGYATSSSRMLEVLVHEGFHTYQHGLESRFPGGSTPQFPDTSFVALTLLNLEGRYLARALGTPSNVKTRAAVMNDIAVRARRCELLGAEECDAERRIEQSEGSATYVAALLLDRRPQDLADSIAPAIRRVDDLSRLSRFHFYDTGLALLLLLDRIGPSVWKERLGTVPPDSLFVEHLGITPALADSLANVAIGSDEAAQARMDAQRAIRAEAALGDSVARAFAAQPGAPVRLRWSVEAGTRRSQFAWIPGHRRSVDTPGQYGDRNTYVIGAREARYVFANEANHLVIRAPSLSICCSAGSLEVRTSLVGQVVRVDGNTVRLDKPSGSVTGSVVLDLRAIEFRAARAEVSVYADSVTIWLR